MKVQVKHTLSSIRAHIGHNSITTFINLCRMCNFLSRCENLSKYRPIIKCKVSNRSYVLPRYEQYMHWRLRIDIFKRYDMLILIDDLTRNLAISNFTEQTVL